ncbi:MAG: hypothetical protein ACRD9W_24815, partial [Terriglobia bacterium]
RLSAGGDGNLGPCCNQDGLFLGRTPLIERRAGGYALSPQSDLERLLRRSSGEADLDRLRRGLSVVKSALAENNLALAQIAAVHLRIPDLPGFRARAALEAEDLLIKTEVGGTALARAGWDPDQHPRAGTPPNPGWFAPTGEPNPEGSARESGAPILPVADRSTGNPDYAARALRMDRNVLSDILHKLKDRAGPGGANNIRIMIPSGDVYFGPEYIGNLRD